MIRDLDLLTVGLTTLDVTVRPVDALPPGGEGRLVESIALSPAGTAAGTAYVAQTLGLSTAVASAVGNDPQGRVVRDMLGSAGVALDLLAVDATMPTSTTILPIASDGERPTLHMVGASLFAPLSPETWQALDGARAVHWAAVGFPGAQPDAARFLAAAHAAGALVTCDMIAPNDASRAAIDQILPAIDIFMPSWAEASFLTGATSPLDAARALLAKGARACLLKLGGDGAMLVTGHSTIVVPAFAITPVDTTSCGDSLCAGFIAGRLRGMADEAALRFACATAALVAQAPGTLGLLQGLEQVGAFADSAGSVTTAGVAR